MTADDEFEDIIQEALRKAASVRCPASTYRNNLRDWISEIRTAIQASEDTAGDDVD